MEETLAYLKDCGTFFVATCEGSQPRVRPFGAICGFEGKLYIVTNNQKPVYRQMKANGRVELCAAKGDGTWIRVAGTVEEDLRREARVAMMDANPSLARMYTVDDGLMTVFRFTAGTATFCSFTAEPRQLPL